MGKPFLFAEFGTMTIVWLPRLHRVGPSASLDKSEYLIKRVYNMPIINMSRILPLDGFSNRPIIGRNIQSQMNTFSLSLIVVLLAVLIIKDLFVVRMATVRVKK
jgi:hypothetical protein